MKELATTKPLVLGLIGLPGAGKSQFAQKFGDMFGAPVLEVDLLARSSGSKPSRKGTDNDLWTAYVTLAGELFKTKRTFVLDGDLNTYAKRMQIRALAKKAGYDILWLWIQTSEAVAEDRAGKQKRGATNIALSTEEFAAALNAFEPPRANEEHTVISGQRTFSSQARPILKKIAESHEADRGVVRSAERPPRRNIFIR